MFHIFSPRSIWPFQRKLEQCALSLVSYDVNSYGEQKQRVFSHILQCCANGFSVECDKHRFPHGCAVVCADFHVMASITANTV